MAYDLGHKEYTVTIKFIVAAGMNGKVLDELRDLRLHVEGTAGKSGCMDHASDVRFTVSNQDL